MNKIERMIKELCSEGVEYRRLSEVCDVLRGKRLTKSQLSEERNDDFKYPVLHGGIEPMGYYDQSNRKAGTTIVINTGNAGDVYYCNEQYWSSDACFSLYPKEGVVLDRFLYYCVAMKEDALHGKIRSGAMPTIDALAVESLLIPVPSIEIQKAITGVLDNFTQYSTKIQAELQMRTKQYEYYRDKIMLLDGTYHTAKYKLGELCSIETGKLNANAAVENGPHMFFTTAKEPSRIDSYRWDTEALLVAGNANIGDVKYYIGKFEAYQRTYVLTNFRNDILPRFLYYLLESNLKQYLDGRKNEAAMTYIVLSTLENFLATVPPIRVQKEIIGILDNFDALCNDMKSGLPAEISARQKQYEYYRNKLLTFKELKK